MKKSKLVVMPNGSLRQIQINGWYIPVDGVKTDSNGNYGNRNWIYADDVSFSAERDWMQNYRPLSNCRLF